LVNGGPLAKLDKLTRELAHYHDTIGFFVKSKEKNIAEFRVLYDQGLSLSEIARRTGYSKSKVRKTFRAAGIAIRDFSRGQAKKHDLTQVMRSGGTPYGFTYLEGKLVMDAREYKIILEIYRLWQLGETLRAIARHLDDRKIPTRFGRAWSHEVVKKIIDRHHKSQSETKN